ncbi:hypothetical protein SteCoe_25778 [Stentor coeruleus]|uniref:non-specific serine/threonine protein kinase n=1 Tax=Stentor coeruleus TaxID=5963 RepID=A0A1R2BEG4_9CILI|nr:hypothetical protein SteCoe_25778 [Stentor coeruleus]
MEGANYKRISHYILKEKIGRGAYGKVFKGIDTDNNEIRAIKVIEQIIMKMNQNQGNTAANLNREISIMKELDHPNILKLYESISTSNSIYLILEYCSGGDLSKEKCISEYKVSKYLRQIISAMKVLNEKRIVHRDLKPANILLDSKNNIKLADFGFARSIKDALANTFAGTPFYMAPEILKVGENMNSYYDNKADIWSIGCIIYELITGRYPFQASMISEMASSIEKQLKSETFLDRKIFSPMCHDLLSKILKIDTNERIDFEHLCQHPFVTGPPLARIADEHLNNTVIHSVFQKQCDMALDFSDVVIMNSESANNQFVLHMKACELLKPCIKNQSCAIHFCQNFAKASRYKNSNWSISGLSEEILQISLNLCSKDMNHPGVYKEHLRNALKLLKILPPSFKILMLIDSIKHRLNE